MQRASELPSDGLSLIELANRRTFRGKEMRGPQGET